MSILAKALDAATGAFEGTKTGLPSIPANALTVQVDPRTVSFIDVARDYIDTVTGASYFGPGQPLKPQAPPGTLPRVTDYPMTLNMNSQPRTEQGGPSFPQLRAFADAVNVMRLCINRRKRQIVKIPLVWKVDKLPGEKSKDFDKRSAADPRVQYLTRFFEKPDQEHDWMAWLSMLLEEVLVIDALAIWPVMDDQRVCKSLRILDGATIKLMWDEQGWSPNAPNPAYAQQIKGCYSEDSEVLTRRGWLPWSAASKSDEFATRNAAGSLEWQAPTDLTGYMYDGPMQSFGSRFVDLLVTPNHRMMVTRVPHSLFRQAERTATGLFLRADDLAANYTVSTRVPLTAGWDGTEIGPQRFPRREDDKHFARLVVDQKAVDLRSAGDSYSQIAAKCGLSLAAAHQAVTVISVRGRRRQPKDILPITMSGDDFCAFMGAYMAEGSCNDDPRGAVVAISQIHGGRGDIEYGELLKRVTGNRTRRIENSYVFNSVSLIRYLKQFGHATDKWIPDVVMNATRRQLGIFWRFFHLGDGHAGRDRCSTSSKRLADQIQEIALKLGKSASIRTEPATQSEIFEDGERRVINRGVHYVVGFRSQKETCLPDISTVDYSGMVYCATVPNGNLYVRRNGKPAWCGNSPSVNMTSGECPSCQTNGYHTIVVNGRSVDGTCMPLFYSVQNPRAPFLYGQCYDDQTEILTETRGFQLFRNLLHGERVATRNTLTKEFEWERPSAIHHYDRDGEMIHFTARSMDIMVTPEHRMLVEAPTGRLETSRRYEKIMTAAELQKGNNPVRKIPVTSVWSGGVEIGMVDFPKTKPKERSLSISGDDFCALIGAYLAEGNLRSAGGIEINQDAKSPAFPVFSALLKRINLTGKDGYNGHAFICSYAQVGRYFAAFGKAADKYVPLAVKGATARQLRIFWEFYMAGDGGLEKRPSKSGRGKHPRSAWRATTVSHKLESDLVEIAQKLGFSASTRRRPPCETVFPNGGKPYTSACRESFVVSERHSTAMSVTAKTVHYAGTIHCVTVPNGIVYVRRNGKPSWCGNSPVQSCLDYAVMAVNRMVSQTEYFTSGNTPEMIIQVPETWTELQIGRFQDIFDQAAGNLAKRRRVKFIPHTGASPFETKGAMLKDDFDEWLARIFCDALNISPTPYIRQLNRSTSQSNADSAREEGTMGDLEWLEALMTRIAREGMKIPGVSAHFDLDSDPDPLKQAQIQDIKLKNGTLQIDEVREDDGNDPFGLPPGVLNGATGVYTPFATGIAQAQANAQNALHPPAPGGGQKQIGAGEAGGGEQSQGEKASGEQATIKLLLSAPGQQVLRKKKLLTPY
jgi:hypothetical protein